LLIEFLVVDDTETYITKRHRKVVACLTMAAVPCTRFVAQRDVYAVRDIYMDPKLAITMSITSASHVRPGSRAGA
jgi:hypothetical protein